MATVPCAFLSKSPKPKRARARVTIFVTRARARLLRCYACSSAVSTAPMSSLKQTERAALSREIRLLKTDPAYVEKVIRQRLNYVRKNEILYLFDKSRENSAWLEAGTDSKHE